MQLHLGYVRVNNWISFETERGEICVESSMRCTRLLVNGAILPEEQLKECITDGILHLKYCNYCSRRLTVAEDFPVTNDTARLLQSVLVECPFLNKGGR